MTDRGTNKKPEPMLVALRKIQHICGHEIDTDQPREVINDIWRIANFAVDAAEKAIKPRNKGASLTGEQK